MCLSPFKEKRKKKIEGNVPKNNKKHLIVGVDENDDNIFYAILGMPVHAAKQDGQGMRDVR